MINGGRATAERPEKVRKGKGAVQREFLILLEAATTKFNPDYSEAHLHSTIVRRWTQPCPDQRPAVAPVLARPA